MEGMERKFEEAWRKAMEGAEVQPSEETWLAMESALIAVENQRMKRKVVFYQRLAAASVLFALLLGALGFYSWKNNSPGKADPATLSQLKSTENDRVEIKSGKQENVIRDIRIVDQTKGASTTMNSAKQTNAIVDNKNRTPDAISPLSADSMTVERSFSQPAPSMSSNAKQEGNDRSSREAKAEESPIKIQKKKEEPIQLPGLLATTEENEKKVNKSEMYKEDLWASLSVASGNYNSGALAPGYNTYPVALASANTPSAMSLGGSSVSRSAVGSSRSVGFTIGKRVTRRWVILGGINYLNQTSGYTSNSSNQGQAYLANYSTLKPASSVTFTNPYPINSVLEFLLRSASGWLFDRRPEIGSSNECRCINRFSSPQYVARPERASEQLFAGRWQRFTISVSELGWIDQYRIELSAGPSIPGFHRPRNPVFV